MTNVIQKAILLLGIAAIMPMASADVAHVEPGAFLNKAANTTAQLVQETRTDREVMQRYMRHFRMSREEVLNYFAGLHPGRLASAGTYTVWNVHDDNIIRSRVFRLKKGTPVFLDSSNAVILKRSCGNPMVAPKEKVVVVVHEKPPKIIKVQTPAPPTTVIVNVPPQPPVAPPPPVIQSAPPVITPPAQSTVINKSESKSYSSFLFIPILLIFNHHDHDHHQKQPVPEPATMTVLGVGAGAMMLRRRKAAKK